MMFHIRQDSPSDKMRCGVSIEQVYNSLDEHLTTEAAIRNRLVWYNGDSVCLACVRKQRQDPAIEAYDRACAKWGDGVAWEIDGRFIVGRWISTMECSDLPDAVVLKSTTKAVEVMGEGKTWEEAFHGVS